MLTEIVIEGSRSLGPKGIKLVNEPTCTTKNSFVSEYLSYIKDPLK